MGNLFCRKARQGLILAIEIGATGALLGGVMADPLQAATVSSIDFKSTGGAGEIDIKSDSPLSYEKQENTQDKQIVIDLKGATLAPAASRPLDASSFNSKVSLISPYQVEGQGNGARVVIQLRDMASAGVTQEGNVLRIAIPGDGASAEQPASSAPGGSPDTTPDTPAASQPASGGTASAAPPSNDKLSAFMESQNTHRFTGKPITLQLREADLTDVFRLIAEASEFNIVLGDDVKGKITLSLVNVPWDQALDVILHTEHLGAERNNNLLRVVTLANLTQEKQQELAAKAAQDASAPRVTRVFAINYAKIDDLAQILTKFSQTASPGAGISGSSASNSVQMDPRTNSIIVRDTIDNITKMKKLIDILDTQTPQVLIEAKVIEATETFTKSIGGALGVGVSNISAGFNGQGPNSGLLGGATSGGGSGTGGLSFNQGAGNFGIVPDLGFISSGAVMSAVLNIGESESTIKVIASPRSVVLDKEKTTITQSTPVVFNSQQVTPLGVSQVQTIQSANLSLTVTPTVTNEGSVLMDLQMSRDIPFTLNGTGGSGGTASASPGQAVANRNLQTKVLVESGSTLVIGGIYTSQDNHDESGFPFLRKIPILGTLFGTKSDNHSKNELFFFITPKILNPKEAGLGV